MFVFFKIIIIHNTWETHVGSWCRISVMVSINFTPTSRTLGQVIRFGHVAAVFFSNLVVRCFLLFLCLFYFWSAAFVSLWVLLSFLCGGGSENCSTVYELRVFLQPARAGWVRGRGGWVVWLFCYILCFRRFFVYFGSLHFARQSIRQSWWLRGWSMVRSWPCVRVKDFRDGLMLWMGFRSLGRTKGPTTHLPSPPCGPWIPPFPECNPLHVTPYHHELRPSEELARPPTVLHIASRTDVLWNASRFETLFFTLCTAQWGTLSTSVDTSNLTTTRFPTWCASSNVFSTGRSVAWNPRVASPHSISAGLMLCGEPTTQQCKCIWTYVCLFEHVSS